MDKTEILIGLAFVGFCLWDIYDGSSSFFLIGQWWEAMHFDHDDHPILFWLCVSIEFIIAIVCIVDGLTHHWIAALLSKLN